ARGDHSVSRLNRLSATAMARQLATREISAVSLLRDCLERIAEREPTVHAWTVIDGDAAMERARMLDSQASTGLLHGVPIAVKDLLDTFDMPTCNGSPIYANHRPAADAACVALARAAGAVVVGKTVTTEFATFHPGPTCNPHNPLHTPGGSSSGSAAAVADFMVPLAVGSQTAGSIVRPAAYCGVIGYKPTFGTVNRVGARMISDTLDTVGGFARSVPDVALLVAALCGRRQLLIDGPSADAPRIGICKTHEWNRAEPETIALFDDVEKQLRGCGSKVRDIALPPAFAGLDVIVAPSTAGEAPAGIAATGDPVFNRIWTLLHVPCVHVPLARGPRGLPLGVSVVGNLGCDRAALLAAAWVHARLGA